MYLKNKPISFAVIFFIVGILSVFVLIFLVPLAEYYYFGAPQFFAMPGTVSFTLFSGPLVYRIILKRFKNPPILIRKNLLDGIWIWGLLYFTGNILAVIYCFFFLDMGGGGAMLPTLFLVWAFLGLPIAMALGGFAGCLSHKLTISVYNTAH